MMNEEQDCSASRQKRILLVDDDADIRHVVEILLKPEGYLVEHAKGGHECLLKVEHNLPDLILLDIAMPNLDGLTVARILKSEPRTASIPIIIVSVLKVPSYIDDALLDFSIKHRIDKPINPDELLTKIRQILGQNIIDGENEKR